MDHLDRTRGPHTENMAIDLPEHAFRPSEAFP